MWNKIIIACKSRLLLVISLWMKYCLTIFSMRVTTENNRLTTKLFVSCFPQILHATLRERCCLCRCKIITRSPENFERWSGVPPPPPLPQRATVLWKSITNIDIYIVYYIIYILKTIIIFNIRLSCWNWEIYKLSFKSQLLNLT